MAAWVPKASDDFNRGDGGLGANWTTIISETALGIASTAVVYTNVNLDCGARYSGRAWIADQASAATLISNGAGGTEAGPCLALRVDDAARTYYRFCFDPTAGGTCTIAVYANGSHSVIDTSFPSFSSGDTLEVRATGPIGATDLEILVNGMSVHTYQDTTAQVPASGSPGIAYSSAEGGSVIDDWVGYELEAVDTQIILPDADIVTTGWSTAPLFSKINDAADGTVITGVAA